MKQGPERIRRCPGCQRLRAWDLRQCVSRCGNCGHQVHHHQLRLVVGHLARVIRERQTGGHL